MAGMVQFLPNKRLASVLVISPQRAYLARAAEWVRRLDTQAAGAEKQFYTYAAQNRRAQELVDVLQTMFARDTGGGRGGALGTWRRNIKRRAFSLRGRSRLGRSRQGRNPLDRPSVVPGTRAAFTGVRRSRRQQRWCDAVRALAASASDRRISRGWPRRGDRRTAHQARG